MTVSQSASSQDHLLLDTAAGLERLQARVAALEARLGFYPDLPKGTVRARILAACPALADPALPAAAKVSLLRDWTYRHCLEQFEIAETIDSTPRFPFYTWSLDQIFSAFDSRVGGVWCGGIGYVFQLVCRSFGFRSWIVDCGTPGTGATHIFNLVAAPQATGDAWLVQDAYYNLTFADTSGAPLDVHDMLRHLVRQEAEQVVPVPGDPEAWRWMIVQSSGAEALRTSWRSRTAVGQERHADGRLLFRIAPTLDRIAADPAESAGLQASLAASGLGADLRYLYGQVFAIYPSAEEGAAEMLQSLLATRDAAAAA